jgi:hypothetical protein
MTKEQIDKAFNNRWRIKSDGLEDDECRRLLGKKIKELCRDFFEAGIALSEPATTSSDIAKNTIATRADSFFQQVFAFSGQYPEQLLYDFYEYWSEPNRSKTKMRFEQQATWDLSRRLARWARNNFNRYDRQPTSNAADKLADILVG